MSSLDILALALFCRRGLTALEELRVSNLKECEGSRGSTSCSPFAYSFRTGVNSRIGCSPLYTEDVE